MVAARRACAKNVQLPSAGSSRPALLYQPSASSIHAAKASRKLGRSAFSQELPFAAWLRRSERIEAARAALLSTSSGVTVTRGTLLGPSDSRLGEHRLVRG